MNIDFFLVEKLSAYWVLGEYAKCFKPNKVNISTNCDQLLFPLDRV